MARIFLTMRLEMGTNVSHKLIVFRSLVMSSRTKVTETRRAINKKNAGAKRKKEDRNKGTTPKFPIHQDKK